MITLQKDCLVVQILIKPSEEPSGVVESGLGAGESQDRKRTWEKDETGGWACKKSLRGATRVSDRP